MNQLKALPTKSDWIFDRSEAGIAITGDPGSGKSVLMRQILRAVIAKKMGAVFLFDPHGDLADVLLRDCLEMDLRVRKRLYYFEPGNERTPIGCLNPLAVPSIEGDSEYAFQQRIDTKAMHSAHLLLSAWGEQNFDQKPQLFKWTTLILRSLAQLGLTIPDARFFLEVGTELYHRLVDALPDPSAQWEFRQLAELDTSRQLELIGSTKSRFFGLDAPVIQAHLGGKPDLALDIRKLIEEQAIVLVSFRPQGMLHKERISVLANFWLSEVFYTIFNTQEQDRLPTFVCCDELPTFRASADLIAEVMKQIRKMKTRFVGAFQGVDSFPKGKDDPLLKNMEHCGTTFVFHHRSVTNAMYFGQMTSLPTNDPLKVKFEWWEKQQYQSGVGEKTVTDVSISKGSNEGRTDTTSHSENWSQTSSTAEMQGENYSETDGDSTGTHERVSLNRTRTRQLYSEASSQAIQEALGDSTSTGSSATKSHTASAGGNSALTTSEGFSKGGDESESVAHNRGTSTSVTITKKTQLVPVLEWRDVLKFMEFYSGEEQDRMAASEVTRLERGEALMLTASGAVQRVQVPMPRQPFDGHQMLGRIIRRRFRNSLQDRFGYQTVKALMEYRRRLLIDFANRVLSEPRTPSESGSEPRRLLSAQGDEDLTI